MSTKQKTDMNDHKVSKEVTCDQFNDLLDFYDLSDPSFPLN